MNLQLQKTIPLLFKKSTFHYCEIRGFREPTSPNSWIPFLSNWGAFIQLSNSNSLPSWLINMRKMNYTRLVSHAMTILGRYLPFQLGVSCRIYLEGTWQNAGLTLQWTTLTKTIPCWWNIGPYLVSAVLKFLSLEVRKLIQHRFVLCPQNDIMT